MDNIKKLEKDLWEGADQLRANSKLTASEYSMPVLGLIFLRHAYNRFLLVKEEIEENLPSRSGRKRPIKKEDFESKSAIYLPKDARYSELLGLPEDEDIGGKINDAMALIESEYPSLAGALPKDYNIFENDLLKELLKIFNSDEIRKAKGDVFGRIYEYFLNKFAMTGAQEGGEFFTPISLVQMIINVIEPHSGIALDCACGSAGMFVQTGHFVEDEGNNANEKITFYGQEKADLNTKLAKMNLVVHGLGADNIKQANTFYEDCHELLGKCDYVMANPPFNVDGVDSEKVKNDPRLPFGLPGINKNKAIGNANYLWIQYFYSYLNDTGRAGFVMASSATDAGGKEKDIRESLVKSGDVDAIISIGNNFFYTRSLPCTLWFFDKNKIENNRNKILMIDARNIFRKVTRKINDFTPEQLKNLTSIVWLYRNESEKYIKLTNEYTEEYIEASKNINDILLPFEENTQKLVDQLNKFDLQSQIEGFDDLKGTIESYFTEKDEVIEEIRAKAEDCEDSTEFEEISSKTKTLAKTIETIYRELNSLIDIAEKELGAKKDDIWDTKKVRGNRKALEEIKFEAVEEIKKISYYHSQVKWLESKFKDGVYEDIEGLCKMVDIDEIEKNDWSLTPGRYVGVARIEDEDFDFEERLREIHLELEGLNEEASELAKIIKSNFEGLGIW